MTNHRVSALVLGFGCCVLPSSGWAQSNASAPAQQASASTPSEASAGPATDASWSSAAAATAPAAPAAPTAAANDAKPNASESSQPAATSTISVATPPPLAPVDNTQSDAPPTLFGHGSLKVGGYGAIAVRYARINHDDGVLGGFEGALLLDHRFAIGFAGYGWSNQQKLTGSQFVDRPYLHFGYGGLLLRYHFYIPETPVMISVATLVGGGAVGLTSRWDDQVIRDNADMFFVFEPQVGAYVNLTRWMRLGLDAGYRVTSGIGKFGFSNSDFDGFSLGGSIGFGWF